MCQDKLLRIKDPLFTNSCTVVVHTKSSPAVKASNDHTHAHSYTLVQVSVKMLPRTGRHSGLSVATRPSTKCRQTGLDISNCSCHTPDSHTMSCLLPTAMLNLHSPEGAAVVVTLGHLT